MKKWEVGVSAQQGRLQTRDEGSNLKRRKLIGLSLGVGLGAFGLGTAVAFIGGLIKNPWKPVVPTAEGKKAVLWTSG